jgi:hypothetical protein
MRWNLRAFPDRLGDRAGQYLAFAVAALLASVLFITRWNSDVNWDGVVYIHSAQEFAAGRYAEGYGVYSKFPFYSLLISFLHPVLANWVIAGRVISFACIVLAVLPLYRITRDLFGYHPAFWSSLTFALLPDTPLYSTMVTLLFFCFSCGACISRRRPSPPAASPTCWPPSYVSVHRLCSGLRG